MTDYTKVVKDLLDTERICRDRMDGQVMLDAAAAIEALQAEVERLEVDVDAAYALMEAQDGENES